MLRETFPLGRIAGVRIGGHWSALVTVGLVTWILRTVLSGHGSQGFLWAVAAAGAVVFVVSLAAHELGHSIVARRNGVHVDRIVLWLLGGVSELADEPGDARAEFRIAIAGPLTSVFIAVVAYTAAVFAAMIAPAGAVAAALVWLAVMNAILAVFNLLPGAPLDGGRVLRALIWWRTGDRLRAATAAARGGGVLGTMLIVVGIAEVVLSRQLGGLWMMLLGWFLQTAAHGELAVAGLRHRLGDTRIRDVMTAAPIAVPAWWTVTDLLHSTIPTSGHRIFPVVDHGDRPIAVLAWSDLARVRARARTTTTLSAAGRPLPRGAIVGVDDLLADAATRVVLRPALDAVAVVDAVGRLCGIVTATDLITACDRSALGLPLRTPHVPDDLPASDHRSTS
ncbi:site-2 protease family protein [Nocardia terpenica]|uniref:Zinc metalloprotease n=1 Tax=Nocardia terpenica TaxID=455432 RepID=A0A161Z4R7_9NOCA|nr:site-2 protease family protein [Nocardia terpenica]KZM74704.1 peptidase M50 [Nocardia terpenica]NQE93680.1 CBS domain-containing protein [Nocardia terpenica]